MQDNKTEGFEIITVVVAPMAAPAFALVTMMSPRFVMR